MDTIRVQKLKGEDKHVLADDNDDQDDDDDDKDDHDEKDDQDDDLDEVQVDCVSKEKNLKKKRNINEISNKCHRNIK